VRSGSNSSNGSVSSGEEQEAGDGKMSASRRIWSEEMDNVEESVERMSLHAVHHKCGSSVKNNNMGPHMQARPCCLFQFVSKSPSQVC
jgi:hypothetical protein